MHDSIAWRYCAFCRLNGYCRACRKRVFGVGCGVRVGGWVGVVGALEVGGGRGVGRGVGWWGVLGFEVVVSERSATKVIND